MQGSNPHLPSLYIYMCIHVYIYLLIWSSDAGSGPVRRMPPDVGCRPPAATGTDHCRMPDRRLLPIPITVGCRATTGPVRQAPPVRCQMLLSRQSGFGWSKPLHVARQPPLLVQVTLNSLCSTHRDKDNNFCSMLYIVGALFDLFMWDIS